MEEALLVARGTEKPNGGVEKESLVVSEVKKQLYLAGPLVVGCLLQNVVQMISVMFVGHLGELALASASMATSFAGVTGFSLLVSRHGVQPGHAVRPGVPSRAAPPPGRLQAAGDAGARPGERPGGALWWCTGEILAWCGQDPEIAAGAGSYIRWMIPALFAYAMLQCHVRFLQTQSLVVPVMLSSGAAAVVHPAVCWLLVHGLGLGRNGAALANAVAYLANVSLLALYVRLSPSCKRSWTGFSSEAFRDVGGFLNLALPSAVLNLRLLYILGPAH
ncbi:hypothetical protein ACP70R_015495 [Stipagrostis hirtigluma subsp. patula]